MRINFKLIRLLVLSVMLLVITIIFPTRQTCYSFPVFYTGKFRPYIPIPRDYANDKREEFIVYASLDSQYFYADTIERKLHPLEFMLRRPNILVDSTTVRRY